LRNKEHAIQARNRNTQQALCNHIEEVIKKQSKKPVEDMFNIELQKRPKPPLTSFMDYYAYKFEEAQIKHRHDTELRRANRRHERDRQREEQRQKENRE
jgi:hypothetical protein